MGSNWSDRFGEVAEVVGVMGRPLQLCRGESLVHSILQFSSGLHATLHCHFNTITMHPLPFFHLSGDKVYTHHHAPPPLLPLIWRQGIHTSLCTPSPSSTYLETRYTHITMHPLPSSTYLETRYTHITMHPLPFFHLSGDKVYTHHHAPLPFFHLSGDKVYTHHHAPLPFFHLSGDKVYTHHHAPIPFFHLSGDKVYIHTSPCTPSPSSTYLETRYTHITMHPSPSSTYLETRYTHITMHPSPSSTYLETRYTHITMHPSPSSTYLETRYTHITMHPLPSFHLSGDKVYTHHHAPPPLLPLIWRQGIHTSPCTPSPSSTYLETRYTHITMNPLPFFHLSGDKVYTHDHAPPPLLPLIWRQGIHSSPCTPSPSSTYLETRCTSCIHVFIVFTLIF